MSQRDGIRLSDTASVLSGQAEACVMVSALTGPPPPLISDDLAYQSWKRLSVPKKASSIIQPLREVALVQLSHSAVAQRPLQILVAEDDLLNQKVVLHLLGRLGHQAEAVSDGPDVLKILQSRHFDLLLLDVHLPLMSGLEVARYLQANRNGSGSKPRLVAMTASIEPGDRERCLEAGMDDFLNKPIRLENLQSALENNPLTSFAPASIARAGAKRAALAPKTPVLSVPSMDFRLETGEALFISNADTDIMERAKTPSLMLDPAVLHNLETELTEAPGVFNKLVKSYLVTSRRLVDRPRPPYYKLIARDCYWLSIVCTLQVQLWVRCK